MKRLKVLKIAESRRKDKSVYEVEAIGNSRVKIRKINSNFYYVECRRIYERTKKMEEKIINLIKRIQLVKVNENLCNKVIKLPFLQMWNMFHIRESVCSFIHNILFLPDQTENKDMFIFIVLFSFDRQIPDITL